MMFFDTLAWFTIVCVVLRVIAIEAQLRTTRDILSYIVLQDRAIPEQLKTLAVGVVAVLWLVFG